MKKVWATFIKEKTLLFRDIIGICILFLMPVFLIVVMALIQDVPFRNYQQLKIDILLVDEDGGLLSTSIKEGLAKSGQFNVIDSINHQPLQSKVAASLVNAGTYKFSITIPRGASSHIVSHANKIVNQLAAQLQLPAHLPVKEPEDTVAIALYFDPATQISFKNAIKQSLGNFLTQTQGKILMDRIQNYMIPGGATDSMPPISLNAVGLSEQSSYKLQKADFTTNSVQHNVPAWSIFAMFFIAIPLAGNMIQERENGSRTRALLIPNAFPSVLTGKLLFYICIGILQFYLMTLVGIFIMPFIGLPSLHMGTHYLATFLTAFCISLAAVGIGLLAGTVFKTPNQVLNLMVVLIVILSALGGIWIPLEIMPKNLQTIGRLSPMYWGLEATNNIYLRGYGLSEIWKDLLKLSGLGICFLILSIFLDKKG